MKLIKCENCGNQLPLVNRLNFTILPHYYKEENTTYIRVVVPLLVYCANCGKTQCFTISHYFNKLIYSDKTTEELILLTLNSEDIMQIEDYFGDYKENL